MATLDSLDGFGDAHNPVAFEHSPCVGMTQVSFPILCKSLVTQIAFIVDVNEHATRVGVVDL